MRIFSFLLGFCLFHFGVKAQNCLTHEFHLQQLQDPKYRQAQEDLEEFTRQYIQNKNTQDTATLIIPTVFHVIHTGGGDNISDAQILDQMRILNLEFKRKQADTALTPVPFRPLGGVFRVEFRLATLDPDGNCTNGITRHYSPVATCAEVGNDVKSLVYWPSNRYLNIWLVASMRYSIGAQCTGGGYAQFPGGQASTDGVEIRGDLIGSIGTATTNSGWGNFRGRYLIHELGHWFNLRHIWGDATCGNDLVSDTPPAEQDNSGCPAFPHNANNTCGSDANGEMTSNYMDYSQGACLNIFTKQQVLRMEAAMNSSASSRNNLWKPANLALTGTATLQTPNCLATPEMKPYGTKTLCGGGVVSFTDVSFGGKATGRRWNFPGGTSTGQPTDSIINVTYSTPGTYSVSLTRKRAGDSATTTYSQKVVVLADTADNQHVAPVNEGFDTPASANSWIALNPDNDEGYNRVATTGFTAAGCLGLLNSNNGPARIDELITPAYDLTTLANATVKYRVAFAKKTSTNRDKLEVYVSNNCGNSWTKRSTKIANDATNPLQTITSNVTTNFSPNIGSTQWREETVALSGSFLVNKFRMKFVFTGSGGNNFYLDDFQITGTPVVANEDLVHAQWDIQLWPNPNDGNFMIRLPYYRSRALTLEVHDLCGRMCKRTVLQADPDVTEMPVQLRDLKPGVYLCSFYTGDAAPVIRKVIIE